MLFILASVFTLCSFPGLAWILHLTSTSATAIVVQFVGFEPAWWSDLEFGLRLYTFSKLTCYILKGCLWLLQGCLQFSCDWRSGSVKVHGPKEKLSRLPGCVSYCCCSINIPVIIEQTFLHFFLPKYIRIIACPQERLQFFFIILDWKKNHNKKIWI